MKTVVVSLVLLLTVFQLNAQIIQRAYRSGIFIENKGWVTDLEEIFNEDEKETLTLILDSFKQATGAEICIVTIPSSELKEKLFEKYTLDLANHWGVGEAGKNNGILIGISTGHRRIRIQNGYGIEEVMSDEETQAILDKYMIPKFKKGNYFEGCVEGVRAIINFLGPKI